MTQDEKNKLILEKAEAVQKRLPEYDIYVYSGPIEYPEDQVAVDYCRAEGRRANALLILTTFGGDPHVAYRIARAFQRGYHQLLVAVDGFCFSAGTLVAIGAKNVIMSEHGMLGPLDTQVLKQDELGEMDSSTLGMTALDSIRSEMTQGFLQDLTQIKERLGGQISLKTAMDASVRLNSAAYSNLFSQIDPMKLGADYRALKIVQHYGTRLNEKARNLRAHSLGRLMNSYPSHECVIDPEEARSLFNHVHAPFDELVELLAELGTKTRIPEQNPDFTNLSAKLNESHEKSFPKEDSNTITGKDGSSVSDEAAGAGEEIPAEPPSQADPTVREGSSEVSAEDSN